MARWARWVVGPFLAAPLGAWALGLGEIELKSALNQPLNAEIRLVSATADELSNLRVELANRETFARYGIDRPAYLSDLRFEVAKNASGQNVVRVASVESITEPFVTILIQASWARGRLLREYTVLLDPPVMMPAPATPTPVAAPSTAPARSESSGRIARPTQAPAAAATVSAPTARAPRPAASGSDGTYGPVQRSETLWAIAERFRPSDQISMNQMMVAIFQANPQAFNGNMNELRRGAILRLPALNEISNLSAAAANQQVAAQTAAWRGRASAEAGARTGAAASAAEPAARLRLVSPQDSTSARSSGAGGADAAQVGQLEGEVERLRGQLEESQRLLDIKDAQLQELQQRLSQSAAEPAAAAGGAAPQPEVDTTAPGVDLEADELESDELFADEGETADELASDATGADEEAADAQSAPVVAPPPASTRVVSSAPPEPSLLDTIISWLLKPVLWIVLGVLALLGTAAWYLRNRQESVEDITGRWEALEAEAEEDIDMQATSRLRARAPSEEDSFVVVEQPTAAEQTQPGLKALPDTGAESADIDATLSSQTAINLDQADPVAEADFHMAYGLYDQAADLLTKALSADPDRKDLKMKLLEVFFVWGNKDQFLDAAQSIRADMGAGSDPDWDKIVIMGRQICPDAELFSGGPAPTADVVDMDLEAGAGPDLDFSLDDSAGGLDMDLGDDFGFGNDDAGDARQARSRSAIADDDTFSGEGPDVDDLDIGAQTAAGLEAALFGDLDREDEPSDDDTRPDLEALADTQESPTLESEAPTAEMPVPDGSDATSEMPTIETLAADAPTMEMPTMETPAVGGGTQELPTLEQPATAFPQSSMVDNTAEINLDDLGLSIEGLGDDAPHELSLDDTASTRGIGSEGQDDSDDLLSATGVTQVLEAESLEDMNAEQLSDDDATMMAPGLDEGTWAQTAILERDGGDADATMEMPAGDDDELDLNLDDLSAALAGGDTVEQPVPGDAAFSDDVFGGNGDAGSLDLDVGRGYNGNADPTSTEEVMALDPQTMTEVGTKLDLARAYIDMGDPEGARSILEEVLAEGDTGQRREAEGLMESLSA